MCYAKPGERCAADTCADALSSAAAYTATRPDGPPLDPLSAGSALATPAPVSVRMPNLITLTPATERLIDAITEAGGRPYIVGGTVRDALLKPGATPKDVDVEVFGLDVERLQTALASQFGHVDEAGKSFSVLKVRAGREDFDISLPRREVKTGAGHRGFDIVPDPDATLLEASARRDFTINALMYDPATERVIDHWGGLEDIRNGVLRHTTEKFAEDPLRVLRGAQFAARFGMDMAPETVELSASLTAQYTELSKERIWGEWRKIAEKGTEPSRALRVLEQTGWERHFPQIAALHGIEQDPGWHPEGDVHTHSAMAADKAAALADAAGLKGDDRAVVVLAAMLHDVGKHTHTQRKALPDGTVKITSHGHATAGVEPARQFLLAIDAPKHLRDRVLPLIDQHMAQAGAQKPTPAAVRRLARRLQPATMHEWALVVAADKGGRGSASHDPETAEWLAIADRLGTSTKPQPRLLRGEHLIMTGMKPGPKFKVILADALAAQDDGAFDDEAGAIAWLKARLAKGPGDV